MSGWAQGLMRRWGIDSFGRLIAIMLAFSLAGSSIVWIRPVLWKLFGFTAETSAWITVPTYLAMIFPIYQIMLLVFGTLLGQFGFFWEKEKKLFRFLCRAVVRRKADPV